MQPPKMSPQKSRTTSLDKVLSETLSRRRSKNQLRQLTTVPPDSTDFSSNNYLSLSSHPEVQRSFLTKLKASQQSFNLLGSGGSRLLDGNSLTAETLEQTIAKFHNAPAGLLFNSAMDANIGLFSCIPQTRDVIIYDELIHASIHDGMRLSRAGRKIPFSHNTVYGEGGKNPSLESVLSALVAEEDLEQDSDKSEQRNVFIAVEGVYSMDGDVTPLVDIVECAERLFPRQNAHIIVDEAHSVGILGDRGKGLVSQLGLEDRVWARVLGFGKAIGCSGGIVLCSPTTRLYLVNYARTLIYTTMMAYSSLISIETAYNFLSSGQATSLLNHLQALIRHTHKLLHDLSDRLPRKTGLFRLHSITPTRNSIQDKEVSKVLTPVIPVLTSHPRSLASHCQQRKSMVRPIVAPTVPKGQERVRICLHAANTFSEVEALVHAMEDWVLQQLEQQNGAELRETQDASLVEPTDVTQGLSSNSKELSSMIDKAKL